jgi:hypothetical protein
MPQVAAWQGQRQGPPAGHLPASRRGLHARLLTRRQRQHHAGRPLPGQCAGCCGRRGASGGQRRHRQPVPVTRPLRACRAAAWRARAAVQGRRAQASRQAVSEVAARAAGDRSAAQTHLPAEGRRQGAGHRGDDAGGSRRDHQRSAGAAPGAGFACRAPRTSGGGAACCRSVTGGSGSITGGSWSITGGSRSVTGSSGSVASPATFDSTCASASCTSASCTSASCTNTSGISAGTRGGNTPGRSRRPCTGACQAPSSGSACSAASGQAHGRQPSSRCSRPGAAAGSGK